MGVKPSKDGADTARVTAHEDHQSTALVTAAADEALLRAAIGADADGLLLGAVRSGLGTPGLAELIRERTGGLLTFSASRAGALLVAAARSAPPDVVEQTRADRAAAEECLEGRFGPFLREHIAAGHRVGEIVEALAAASGGALILTAARVGRLIEDERDRGGPYQKPPKSTRPAAEQPPQPARRKKAPRTRDGARSSGTPAKRPSSVEHSTDPHQPSPRSAPRRLRQLANDLERALRTDPTSS